MKNLLKLIGITVMILTIGIFTVSCGDLDDTEKDGKLLAPKNIKIEIESNGNRERMVVTWDAVSNASGYEIYSVSVGCGSGNRLINTEENTAFGLTFESADTQRTGTSTVGDNSVLHGTQNNSGAVVDKANNGVVEIIGENKIAVTLMPEYNTPGDNTSGFKDNSIMASSLRVKVKAIGGTVKGLEYASSDYSEEVIKDTSAL